MDKEKISVIVPVYKVEKYLRKCIESIINQTYRNIEIILIDDGSPDSCGQICDEYASKDNRIRVIHQPNQGLSSARNEGLRHVSGSYITFVDSDDYIRKDFLYKLYQNIKKSDVDISICAEEYVRENRYGGVEYIGRPYSSYNGTLIVNSSDGLSLMLRQVFFDSSAWGKLYKSYLFEDVLFPVGYTYEDQGTIYKPFLKSKKIAYTSEKMYYYLQRKDSILHSVLDAKHFWDGIKMVEQQYYDVVSYLPELHNSAKSRLLSMYFHAYLGSCKINDKNLQEYSWAGIDRLKKSVLFDDKARLKARIASFAALFGQNFIKLIFLLK